MKNSVSPGGVSRYRSNPWNYTLRPLYINSLISYGLHHRRAHTSSPELSVCPYVGVPLFLCVLCVCVYFLYALFTLCVFSLYIFLSAVTARELDTCSVLSACLKKWLINTQLSTKTQLHVIISSLSVLKSTS